MTANDLESRRKQLGMSVRVLSERSGVPVATLNRLLAGHLSQHKFSTVANVAEAMGITISFEAEPVVTVKERQAASKARRLVALVQGTSALEAQAVNRPAFEAMVRQTIHELMAGSPRRLWG